VTVVQKHVQYLCVSSASAWMCRRNGMERDFPLWHGRRSRDRAVTSYGY